MEDKLYISRKEQAKLTKKKIFDTTLLLIKKKGFNKITIREICQIAEISVGTFYLYFSSKDEILLDIYKKVDLKLEHHFLSSLPQGSQCDTIIFYILFFLEQLFTLFDKEIIREIYRIDLFSSCDDFLLEERPLFSAICKQLEEAQAAGLLSEETTPLDLCRKIHLFIRAYVMHWLIGNDISPAQMTELCATELRRYLSLYLVTK